MYIGLCVKYPLLLSGFNESRIISTDFRKMPEYRISWNLIQWKASCSHANGRTDRTKLIVAFCNFLRTPLKTVAFRQKSAFTDFVCISEQTVIIFLYSIYWPFFITEKECVYCAVRIEYLNKIWVSFRDFPICTNFVYTVFMYLILFSA